MATFHDSSFADDVNSGTTLSAADTLSITVGDVVVVGGSCEGANGVTFTFDTGASTPVFTEANALFNASNNDFRGTTHYWIATSTGTVTIRMILSAARTFRHFRAFSFTPTSGYEFLLDTVAAAEGNSLAPSSGSATAATAGASISYFPFYDSHVFTEGSGWVEPVEFEGSLAAHAQYKLHSAGSLTGDATISAGGSNNLWIAQMAIFKEQSLGGGGSLALEDPVWLALEQQTNPLIVTVY